MGENPRELERLTERVATLETLLHGDGSVGLRGEVLVLTSELTRLAETVRAQNTRMDRIERLVGYAIGGLYVLGLAATLFIKFWK